MSRRLTGFTPSGHLHLGNYFGAIRPIIAEQHTTDTVGVRLRPARLDAGARSGRSARTHAGVRHPAARGGARPRRVPVHGPVPRARAHRAALPAGVASPATARPSG